MATVLFVDDEGAIRKAVRAWLSRKGHVVHEAATLDDARRAVLDHALDGVFIDLWVGAESGIELLGWIEDLDAELGRRTAFVTGDIFAGILSSRGFGRPIFTKPFQLADLEQQVALWCRGHTVAEGGQSPRHHGTEAGASRRSP